MPDAISKITPYRRSRGSIPPGAKHPVMCVAVDFETMNYLRLEAETRDVSVAQVVRELIAIGRMSDHA